MDDSGQTLGDILANALKNLKEEKKRIIVEFLSLMRLEGGDLEGGTPATVKVAEFLFRKGLTD